MIRSRYISITLLLVFSQNITAQHLAFRHFSTNEGLPNPLLFMMKTGTDGSLWIGTDNGFSRFDGNSFHNYYPKQAAGTNYVLDMDSLPNKQILLNVYKGGLCLMKNDSFSMLKVETEMDPRYDKRAMFGAERLFSISYDPYNKCIWVINSMRELYKMTLNGDRLTVRLADSTHRPYYSIYISKRKGAAYFASGKGLCTYTKQGSVQLVAPALINQPVHRIFEKNDDEFVLGMGDGIMTFNMASGANKIFRYAAAVLQYDKFLYDERQQMFWIPGSDGGIFIFNEAQPALPYLHIMKGVTSNYLYADNDGNVWIGTYGGGLYQFRQTYILNYNKDDGMNDSYITHVAFGRDKNPYISCLYGFYRFYPAAQQFSLIQKSNTARPLNKSFTLYNGGQAFINGGHILLGSGRLIIDRDIVTYDAMAYNRDTLLVSDYSSLMYFDAAYRESGSSFKLPKANCYAICRKGDSILLSTSGGLYISYRNRWTAIKEKEGLGDGYVRTSLVRNDTVYCGTRVGLFAIDRNGKIAQCWKGLLADEVTCLSTDNSGGLWVGTPKGLYLQANGRLYHFDMYDGFVASEVTHVLAHDRQLYVGTTQGLSIADLNSLYNYIGQPFKTNLPAIEKIMVNGREAAVDMQEVLRLSPDENNLEIIISLVQFNPRPVTILEYSLDNGQTWKQIVNREISLRSLNYGSYTLMVRTRHRNEDANYYMPPFRFRIALPWYRNVFVIIGASLALSALGIWLYSRSTRNRRRRGQQQLALKKQMLDLEQKALAALLNPHFVFNAINSINYYMANGEEEKYTRLLTDLSRLIRLNLNNTYKDSVTLKSELEIVELYVEFEKHRFIRQPLQFDVIYESFTPPDRVKIPSMIIQPFVENAIWHGLLPRNGGRVWLHITDAPEQYLQIEVRDDGIDAMPLKTESAATGVRGIQLIRERIDAYNQLNKQHIQLFIMPQGENGHEGFFVRILFPLLEI